MYLCFLRYLIEHGAHVGAVNSEGELPLDVATEDAMERLLKAEIKKQGKSNKCKVACNRILCVSVLSVFLGPSIRQTCNPVTENQIFSVMSDDAKLKENFYVQSVILLKLED